MMEKIEWYQEVLKLDPDSKVFFPLAKLLRDSQQPDKAIEVLRAGLQHSSVFFEARLLLIQILFEQSRAGECSDELSTVTDCWSATLPSGKCGLSPFRRKTGIWHWPSG